MNLFFNLPRRERVLGVVPVALALALAGCGGGGGSTSSASASASSSSTATESSSGTVTGFGSVFVDGVELEDAKAVTRVENADGSYSLTSTQLGQRVRVAHDATGTASTVTVDAAVIGTVASGSVDATALTFTVAGQSVKANSDSTSGPLTVYGGGYTAFSDIAAGDLVEIHGSAVYDSTAKVYVVQATRIEKKSAISAVRVMGKIASLDTTAKTFAINSLTVAYGSAILAPTTATLADGVTVVAWGAQNSLVSGSSGLSLTASRVRVLNAGLADDSASGATQLGGVVSNYSVSAGTFELEGVKVIVGSATLSPTGATIANGAYVQVSGTVGSDASITATSIKVRQQSTTDDTASVRLIGAIESLSDQTAFVVRGVPVDASAITLSTACPGDPCGGHGGEGDGDGAEWHRCGQGHQPGVHLGDDLYDAERQRHGGHGEYDGQDLRAHHDRHRHDDPYGAVERPDGVCRRHGRDAGRCHGGRGGLSGQQRRARRPQDPQSRRGCRP